LLKIKTPNASSDSNESNSTVIFGSRKVKFISSVLIVKKHTLLAYGNPTTKNLPSGVAFI
jgi:hypothetical protein